MQTRLYVPKIVRVYPETIEECVGKNIKCYWINRYFLEITDVIGSGQEQRLWGRLISQTGEAEPGPEREWGFEKGDMWYELPYHIWQWRERIEKARKTRSQG